MMKKFSFFIIFAVIFAGQSSFGLNKHYIETRIKNVKAAIEKKKVDYLKLRKQYSNLIKQTKQTKVTIRHLKIKIKRNKTGLEHLNARIVSLKKDIRNIGGQLIMQKQELYNEFKKYYEYSRTSPYYKKGIWYEYMNAFIARYMQEKIKRYISKRTYLKNKLLTLKLYVDRKEKFLSNIQIQETTLNRQMNRLSILTGESLRKRKVYLNEIKKLSLEQNRLRSILSNIIEQEKKKVLAEVKKRKHIVKNNIITTIKQKNSITAYTVKKQFGSLNRSMSPPVKGKIIDTFGKKYDTLFKVYTRNDGIDIRAEKGMRVKTVYQGKVDYAGSLPGYGGVVIVNHLNGYYTVYGGIYSFVKVGQYVKTHEYIGKMETNKLHFELRRHSKAINPLKLLSRRLLK